MAKHRLTASDIASLDCAPLPQVQPYPAMQFFAADWLSGTGIQAMTPEQMGGFVMLVAQAWIQKPPVSLPNDDAQLAQLSRLGVARWKKAGALIRSQFVTCKDTRLRNPKQFNVWLDMLDTTEKRRGTRHKQDRFVNTTTSFLSPPSNTEDEAEAESGEVLPEGVQGKPLTGSQRAVADVEAALREHTDGFTLPTPQRIAKWIFDYGLPEVLAAITEHGRAGTLDGKPPNYLHQLLENRKKNPRRVTVRSEGTASQVGGSSDWTEIDEAREFIGASRSSVRYWERHGAKPEAWPIPTVSREEWEAYDAWLSIDGTVRTIEEFRAERMVTA